MLRPSFAAALAALALTGQQAQAHHPFAAEYDGNAPVLLRGSILAVEWAEPHASVHILVTNQDPPQAWVVEAGSPATIAQNGVERSSLAPGVRVIVRGYQARDKSCPVHPLTGRETCKANARDLTFESGGGRAFIGTAGAGAPPDGLEPGGS